MKMQPTLFVCIVLLVYSANGQNPNPVNVTIVVLGRSGTGISSTVKQLIGSNKVIIPATGNPTFIQEFQFPIDVTDGQQRYMKILDVEGFVDGKSIEEDAEALSSLKFYLSNTSGLNGALPNFFLVVSSFEDNRLQGKNSLFTQTLKRVEILQKALYKDTSPNTVFLLTKFLSTTKSTQRRPQERVQLFSQTILDETDFKQPIAIVLGENRGIDYGLKSERGYSELPNRELYPKNVFDKFIEVAFRHNDLDGANGIKDFVDGKNREQSGEVYSKYCENYLNFKPEFLKKLHMLNSDVQDTELNRVVQVGYDSLDASTKDRAISDLIELQTYFQSKSLTTISQLPKTALERVKFFRDLRGLNSDKLALLKAAFRIEMPEIIQHLVVGYGYDALQDMSLEETPFRVNLSKPSPIGYRIPDFLTCSKLTGTEKVDFGYFSETVDAYLSLRSKFLEFQNGEVVDSKAFEGSVKLGFNLKPEEFETLVSLSTVQEVRAIECKLNDGMEVNEQFRDSVNALKPFNSSDKDSEVEWKSFFRHYGTHVVSKGFGGGYMDGSVSSPALLKTMDSKSEINETLEALTLFKRFNFREKPSYRFFGGNRDERLENVYDLHSSLREQLLQSWAESLNYEFQFLEYELSLIPISVFAKLVDDNLGTEVDRATRLLLSGELVYKRPTKKPGKGKGNSNKRPTSSPTVRAPPDQSTPEHLSAPPTMSSYQDNRNPVTTSYNYDEQSPVSNRNTEVMGARCPDPTPPSSVPEISFAPPTPSPPKKEILEDYTTYTVGQGYHMLKEIVLPMSPFKFGGDVGKLPEYRFTFEDVVLNGSASCEHINTPVYNSKLDYLQNRMQRVFGVHSTPSNFYEDFEVVPIPGTFIRDNQKNKDLRLQVQRALSQYKIGSQVRLQQELSPEFARDLSQLPRFIYTQPNCEVKMTWKRFFTKWGTHYVKSTHLGYSYEVILHGIGDVEIPIPSSNQRCEPLLSRTLEWGLSSRKLAVLKPTFELVSYRSLVTTSLMYASFDEAIYQLMTNDLACS